MHFLVLYDEFYIVISRVVNRLIVILSYNESYGQHYIN